MFQPLGGQNISAHLDSGKLITKERERERAEARRNRNAKEWRIQEQERERIGA